ncbi:MAG: acyl-CoA dehydrogenase [Acidimicrobiia bacterium]|nr:acyl-CoA dehydrogenase [Acidimicrobiia bacterium]
MSAGLDKETLDMILGAIDEFAEQRLPDAVILELDEKDEFPEKIVREMGSELGVQLLFIAEEYGGMGGDAIDVYRVCERMARIDVGVATGVLATFLGADPIIFGGTPEQVNLWMSKVAEEGLLMAYGATEPEAGSDLASLKTKAVPVTEGDETVGYKISGNKQWISNGGYADLYTILANAPGGPTWFIVDRDSEGFSYGKPEDKHGIRLSNTAALSLDEVEVGLDRVVGEVEGQGLQQAQKVFGYTRVMVAAFGLGAGWAALERAAEYSTGRIQAGGPLSTKQGYTHKLIIPHVLRLEASRAYIEYTARRIKEEEGTFNTEGAIAKYMATVAGNAAADDAIQALGGYGYTKEYMVEKIKRDVRITTIYEGTSEIMEMTIARDRWQEHLKTRGGYYHERAGELEALHRTNPEVGAGVVAIAFHALAEVLEAARVARLTRNQHLFFRLGEIIAYVECAGALAERAAALADGSALAKTDERFDAPAVAAISRAFAREAADKAAEGGARWLVAAGDYSDEEATMLSKVIGTGAVRQAQRGLLDDMQMVADALYAGITT